MALSACGASGGSGAPAGQGVSASSHTLAPGMYFNPVPTCSALDSTELQGLLGGTAPASARPTTGNHGELKSCTWAGGSGASSNVLLSLEFGVSPIECSQLAPARGVSVIPGVGKTAYYENGLLTAWNDGLEVQLQVASSSPPEQLPTLMSTDVNTVFARMGAF